MECSSKPFINNIFPIFLQVLFVFIFLTIFFYVYVSKKEEEQFGIQIDKITDTVFNDYLASSGKIPQKNKIGLVAILNSLQQNVGASFDKQKLDVEKNNRLIEEKSKNLIIGVIIVFIVFFSLIRILNICIPLKEGLMHGIVILFFIFLTEFAFLNLITSKYESSNPRDVELAIGNAILNYRKN